MNTGKLLILFGLLFSAASMVFYLRSIKKPASRTGARAMYYSASVIILGATVLLVAAFLGNAFHYAYVFENSSMDLPLPYKLSALWAGREGSYLLWLLFLAAMGSLVVSRKSDDEPYIATGILVLQLFLLALLALDTPFAYVWESFSRGAQPGQVPPDGAGMNPVLMTPWMAIHPPVLFIGYASAAIPAAMAFSALMRGETSLWSSRARKWVIFSVMMLGLGNILGSVWAYSILGWGGYWAWDPVENSSLIPWLVSVILLHVMIIQRRTKSLTRLAIVLALFYPVLVFFGTYLTRSGVMADFSVHSYSPYRFSSLLLAFILLLSAGSSILVSLKWKTMEARELSTGIMTWDNLLIFGLISLGIFTIAVLALTTLPLLTRFLGSHRSAATSEIYNLLSLPFAFIILLFTLMSSLRLSPLGRQKTILAGAVILSLAAGIALNISGSLPAGKRVASMLICALSVLVILQSLHDVLRIKSAEPIPSRMAHIGMALFILGSVIAGYYSSGEKREITRDAREPFPGIDLTFLGYSEAGNGSLVFRVERSGSMAEYHSAYYYSNRTNSNYREPLLLPGITYDTYVIPEEYRSGFSRTCIAVVEKGGETSLGSLKIRLTDIRVEGMKTDTPKVWADLVINGSRISPGLSPADTTNSQIMKRIPGTDRDVAVHGVDPENGLVELFITPGRSTEIPADSVIVDVSRKPMMSMVWLGALFMLTGLGAVFTTGKRNTDG